MEVMDHLVKKIMPQMPIQGERIETGLSEQSKREPENRTDQF